MDNRRINLIIPKEGPGSFEPPRFDSKLLVPRQSISGRALIAIVAIMTFLASLTSGAVILVSQAASEWQSDIAREVTIQIIPAPGQDVDDTIDKIASLTRAFPGISDVRAYSKEESTKLLEPWLGSGLVLDELPVPRLIVVKIALNATPDIAQLRTILKAQAPSATLDDHHGWINRMRAMSNSVIAAGAGILLLMIAGTVLSVAFATRGAMATNKTIIEVLHFVGAKNGFIAANFQQHFLLLGLKGGALGGGAAMVLFAVVALLSRSLAGTAAGDEISALFGSFTIGFGGYVVVLIQVVLIAGITAFTSRYTVNRTLEEID
jgi:cell division transport system permease protein